MVESCGFSHILWTKRFFWEGEGFIEKGDRIVDPRMVDPRIVDPRMVDPKES